jgi:hypothetical protein
MIADLATPPPVSLTAPVALILLLAAGLIYLIVRRER